MANQYVTQTTHNEAIKRFDYLFWGIIGILGLSVVTMVIMVAGMLIQAWQTRPIPEYYGSQKQIIDKLGSLEGKLSPTVLLQPSMPQTTVQSGTAQK